MNPITAPRAMAISAFISLDRSSVRWSTSVMADGDGSPGRPRSPPGRMRLSDIRWLVRATVTGGSDRRRGRRFATVACGGIAVLRPAIEMPPPAIAVLRDVVAVLRHVVAVPRHVVAVPRHVVAVRRDVVDMLG